MYSGMTAGGGEQRPAFRSVRVPGRLWRTAARWSGETLGFWVEHPGPVTVEAFDPEGGPSAGAGDAGEAQVTVTLEEDRLVWTEAN